MPAPRVTLQVPTRFYEDHRARDCGETGVVIKERSRYFEVSLDAEAYDDLLSDAEFYWDGFLAGSFEPEMLGLCHSAKATAARLRKAGRPGGELEKVWDPKTATWKVVS